MDRHQKKDLVIEIKKMMIIVWFQVKVIVGRNSLSLGTDMSFWNSLLDPTRLSNMW